MFLLHSLLLALSISSASAAPKNPKRGVAFPAANNPTDVRNLNQSRSAITWVYDWGLDVPDYLKSSNVEYYPMLWGADGVENFAEKVKAQGAKTVLLWNEPDFASQSNMDPVFAAELWMKYVEPLKADGVRLGGPAVTGSGSGQPWLTQFFDACRNCTVDFLPLHWYGTGVGGFYDYLIQVHNEYPKLPIWVTEYADTALNDTDVEVFLNATTKFMDDQEWIEKYCWFGYHRPENGSAYNFLEADGSLNSLGRSYIGAGTVERSGPVRSDAPTVVGPTQVLKTASVGTAIYRPTNTSNSGSSFRADISSGHVLAIMATVASCFMGVMWTWL